MKTDERIRALGARLRELRIAAKMTQAELAREADVTVETVARIERTVRGAASANTNPSLDTIFRLADALGAHPTELLGAPAGGRADRKDRELGLAALSRIAHDLDVLRRILRK